MWFAIIAYMIVGGLIIKSAAQAGRQSEVFWSIGGFFVVPAMAGGLWGAEVMLYSFLAAPIFVPVVILGLAAAREQRDSKREQSAR
ncbi:MAG: hypothetical protein FJX11_22735 [Alphaproteobacteria bacterium]|nr:hypothetical protein [Alphaproteobacteria bacterium]